MAIFTTILGSAFLAAVANALVATVVATALNMVAKALTKKPKADTQALDFEQMVQRRLSNGQALEVLTGRRIVAGIGAYDDAYGNKNEHGVSVSVLSAKPCTAFHQLYLDGEPVELSGDPTQSEVWVTSHFLGRPAPETITIFGIPMTIGQGEPMPRVRVRVFLGHDNSGLGSFLGTKSTGKFTANDNFGDYCVVVLDCKNTNDDLDEENGENYIPFQGYPEFKVELSGVKVCDPRLPGSLYADESTYVYSDNAALIDAQYDYGWYSGAGPGRALIVGNGYPVELMDLDQIKSNADYCDAEGLTCAGVVRSGSTGDQEEIWKCYNADRVEHAAKVFSIPEGNRNFAEIIDVSEHPAAFISAYDKDGFSTEVYNEISTVYAEPEEYYGEKDLPIYSKPEWIAADDHIPRQMSLPLMFVTDKVQAGKLEKQEIYISRSPATCTISNLPFGFLRVPVGSVITLTGSNIDGANDKDWIVKGRGQTVRGDISLSLRECAAGECFSFSESEIPAVTPNPPPLRPWPWWERLPFVDPFTVAGIGANVSGILDGTAELTDVNLAGRTGGLSSELNGIGSDVSGILDGTAELTDVNLAGRTLGLGSELDTITGNVGGLDNQINNSTTGLTATHTEVQAIVSGTRLLGDVKLTEQGSLKSIIAAQAANINTALSDAAGSDLSATANIAYAAGTSENGALATTGTVTITASGGTSPYSYSWAKVSGDNGIAAVSQSAAATNWTGTPGINGNLSATWRCTVTDSASTPDTQQVDVTVTLTDNTNFGGSGGGLEP